MYSYTLPHVHPKYTNAHAYAHRQSIKHFISKLNPCSIIMDHRIFQSDPFHKPGSIYTATEGVKRGVFSQCYPISGVTLMLNWQPHADRKSSTLAQI